VPKTTMDARRVRARIECATWLGESCLLVVTSPALDRRARLEAWLRLEQRCPLEARSLSIEVDIRQSLGLLLLGVTPSALRDGEAAVVTFGGQHGELRVDWRDLKTTVVSSTELVRLILAPLNDEARTDVTAFLASVLDLVPPEERAKLSDQLFEFRQALRERLPAMSVTANAELAAHVDRLLAIDDRSFFLEGWAYSAGGEVERLSAVSPEGGRAEIAGRVVRVPRSDVADFFASRGSDPSTKYGMLCFFELESPSLRREGWILEIADQRGRAFELNAPEVIHDPVVVRNTLLAAPPLDQPLDEDLIANHLHPAVTRAQRRAGGDPVVVSIEQFGTPPENADVSIVVPIYRRVDHVESQLAALADDPDVMASDLVYVLDSPEQAEELRLRAADLFPLYRVPLRTVVLQKNTGFAGACNAGAGIARGRLLLLLNSDVLPDRQGWLGTMRDFYDATPNIGALGPKLMYEDDSIQHAGMHYRQLPGSHLWVDAHYYKGMHRSLSAANVARRVPLVSGACLMVNRALYERLDGLPTVYVQGDYEDAEFCLRLIDEGLDNWYLPDAELYHLEGQSYAAEARRPLNRYNMWLHNDRCAQRIIQLSQLYDG
jgi:GT2 family glycosyltransferase